SLKLSATERRRRHRTPDPGRGPRARGVGARGRRRRTSGGRRPGHGHPSRGPRAGRRANGRSPWATGPERAAPGHGRAAPQGPCREHPPPGRSGLLRVSGTDGRIAGLDRIPRTHRMLMPILPLSLAELLAWFRPCLTAPTFTTFTALCCGFLAQTGRRTVTGMLLGARLSQVWSHHRAHRFVSRTRWSADQLRLLVSGLIVRLLVDPDAPISVAVDNSLMRRRGRKVSGAAWHHDPLAVRRRRTA